MFGSTNWTAGKNEMKAGSIHSRVLIAVAVVGAAATPGRGPTVVPFPASSVDSLTFNRDIAPIVFEHCSTCHRPGRPTPFNLLTYRDVQSLAPLIVDVVERGAMPPWLPEEGYGDFAGVRRLSADQIAAIGQWVSEGLVEGDSADLPPPPGWTDGWQLGEPDLVVELPAYTAQAEGRDVYRNLVAPIPVTERRYVVSVELQWGDTRVVHHSRMMVDTTNSSRDFDERDPAPGFDGMDIVSAAENPPGHFVGWAPGRVQALGQDDLAWPLDPGTDLVLQLHLRPTGRPELVQPKVGFYLSDVAPTKQPVLVMLGSFEIDIPPGESSYRVTDTYELPVDVEGLSVYPHAHYLGKQVQGIATLPNGETKWLLRIDRWDFNSQDAYSYEDPIFLPAGTTLSMEWVYDNSSENPLNPNSPPKRVRYGSLSSDEMSDLVIQVLPRARDDLPTLQRDLAWKYETRDVLYLARQQRMMGDQLAGEGRFAEAIPHYQEALRLRMDDAAVYISLAKALVPTGDSASAVMIAERGAQLTTHEDPTVLDGLAAVYAAVGDTERAVSTAQQALRLATAAGADDLAAAIGQRLAGYRRRSRD